ncbi:hypothetical protein [Magnetospirillum sp. 64-120]|uniref:hypothetical protein n=1 Tax=Magnetospirillum sp. 64-120 TaxID=1895778 RepID=UPI00092A42A1|nr:hypothetical protein [Magnetospirillum sp. 64-120]OJX79986.1 MAG: hypothetical protein BGO92_03510 [Magnetospirillum sp. 64-120]
MNSKPNQAQSVSPMEARANQALARAHLQIGTAEMTEADAANLSIRLAGQLAGLPDDQRRLRRRDLALVVHDLEALVDALETELGELAGELKALNHRTGAVRAYGAAKNVVALRRP